jgi:hypothetical protein
MLGDKIGEATGRVTGRRVLSNPGGSPKVETSFEASGTMLGVAEMEIGTYWSVMRPGGMLYGEGQGVLMGKGGEQASWMGSGIGTLKKDGGVSYRGAIYFETSSGPWARLNAVAAVFEFEVDAQGNSRAQLWEWK